MLSNERLKGAQPVNSDFAGQGFPGFDVQKRGGELCFGQGHYPRQDDCRRFWEWAKAEDGFALIVTQEFDQALSGLADVGKPFASLVADTCSPVLAVYEVQIQIRP
jgi:hypothetical protein